MSFVVHETSRKCLYFGSWNVLLTHYSHGGSSACRDWRPGCVWLIVVACARRGLVTPEWPTELPQSACGGTWEVTVCGLVVIGWVTYGVPVTCWHVARLLSVPCVEAGHYSPVVALHQPIVWQYSVAWLNSRLWCRFNELHLSLGGSECWREFYFLGV